MQPNSPTLDDLDRLSEIPEQDAPPRKRLLHANQLHQLPKSEWVIENILPTNKVVEIFGMPGQGKSFTLVDISLSVAQFGNVIYIAAEDAEDYEERVEAWCKHHKAGCGGLHFWPEPLNLFDQTSLDSFLSEILYLQPVLIVVDPLANCFATAGRNENGPEDMGIAIAGLNYLRRQTQAAIFVCHHTGWNDSHERGHSSLRAACRVVMKLANNDGLLKLTCEKINGAKALEPRYFQLVPSANSVVLVPTAKISQRDAPITQKQIDVLEALSLSIFVDGATFTQLVEHLNVAKSSLNYSLTKLKDHGYITHAGGGHMRRYRITDSGTDVLLSAESEAVQSSLAQTPNDSNSTELSLNWRVKPEALRSVKVQSALGTENQSSVEFSESSMKVQSNGSSSVQSLSLRETELLNTEQNSELNGHDPDHPPDEQAHDPWHPRRNGGTP